MTADGAECRPGYRQPGAVYLAFIDRVAQGDVSKVRGADIAGEGEYQVGYVVLADGVYSEPTVVTFNVSLPNNSAAASSEDQDSNSGTNTLFLDSGLVSKINNSQEENEDEVVIVSTSTFVTDHTADVAESYSA